MKKYLFLSFIITTLFYSCNDFLEIPSDTKFVSSSLFESVTKAEMTVVGCYENSFNRELYYQLGMGTDECISTESNTNSKNQISNYVYTPSIAPTGTYTAMYSAIEYANVCIKGLSEMNVSASDQKKIDMLLGEAYAIRGMSYLNIVRFFGDVPYPTIPTVDKDTYLASREPRDMILDGCISDLQKAIGLLPWKSENMVPTVERFTKNSAYGILARVALYAAGYSLRWDLQTYDPASVKLAQRSDQARIRELYKIAADACEAIILQGENQLVSSYESIFRDLVCGRYNNESMLEMGQYGPNVNGYVIGYTNGIFVHTNCKPFGKSQPAMAAIPTYWYDFEDGDLRRDVTICNYGVTADNTRQMNPYSANTIGKFRITWKENAGTDVSKRDINWPMLRYSDVLLMYAEALNEYNNGPTADAIAKFEDVRARGFGNDRSKIGATPTDYQGFRDAIINERKLELGFEAWRRTDLIRWGILYETLTATKQNVMDMANQTGKYANADLYRAYKKEKALSFADPVVAVDFIGYTATPSAAEQQKLQDDGYTLLKMYGNVSAFNGYDFTADAVWVNDIFRGLEKDKVELLPLATDIMDVNPGLAGQQHPKY